MGNKRKEHNVEKDIQWVTTLSLTKYGSIFIRLAVVTRCFPNLWNPAKFHENSYLSQSKNENDLFSHPSLVWRPRSGDPLEFLDETYPAKTRGMGLPYGENCIIPTSIVFDWSTRVTDRRTDGRYHIARYAMLSGAKTSHARAHIKRPHPCGPPVTRAGGLHTGEGEFTPLPPTPTRCFVRSIIDRAWIKTEVDSSVKSIQWKNCRSLTLSHSWVKTTRRHSVVRSCTARCTVWRRKYAPQ